MSESPLNELPQRATSNGQARKQDAAESLDVSSQISELLRSHEELKRMVMRPKLGSSSGGGAEADDLEKKIARGQSLGTVLTWIVSGIGLLFSAGVAWAVFLGANATDAEVDDATRSSVIDHNAGIDPEETDPVTGKPRGHHPDMRAAVESNTQAIREISEEVLPRIDMTQRKLDKRSAYQFELGRWQSQVTEAERKKRMPPPKPKTLEDLERDIMLGQFE